MRKVTATILKAFNNRQKKTIGNTSCDGDNVYLHGNKIVTRNPVSRIVYICDGGYNSQTTRERLKAFTNKSIRQKQFALLLDGKCWDGKWTEA